MLRHNFSVLLFLCLLLSGYAFSDTSDDDESTEMTLRVYINQTLEKYGFGKHEWTHTPMTLWVEEDLDIQELDEWGEKVLYFQDIVNFLKMNSYNVLAESKMKMKNIYTDRPHYDDDRRACYFIIAHKKNKFKKDSCIQGIYLFIFLRQNNTDDLLYGGFFHLMPSKNPQRYFDLHYIVK